MKTMCVAAANYIIRRTNEYNEGRGYWERIFLTGKRLQKMLFFCDAQYMLDNNGESMFRDEYYAWPSGPVIPSVYYDYMQYQSGEMLPIDETGHTPLTPEMKSVIDEVFEATKEKDTAELIDFSHAEDGPWKKAYEEDDIEHKQLISKSSIYDYYKQYAEPRGGHIFPVSSCMSA